MGGYKTLIDEGNYLLREDTNANFHVSYYFPLRNEKNKPVLAAHMLCLMDVVDRVEFEVELQEANGESLEAMGHTLTKDIQVFRSRITELGMTDSQTENTFSKTMTLEYLQNNLKTNARRKMEMAEKLNQRKDEEFADKHSILDKAQAKRVIPNDGRQSF